MFAYESYTNHGNCRVRRRDKLRRMTVEDLSDKGWHVPDPLSKTKHSREFVVTYGFIKGINLMEIIQKYDGLRPVDINNSRFLFQWSYSEKYSYSFLGFPKLSLYTGHCFRRSSA